MPDPSIAFDKSVRRLDKDGRLHVEIANISKANVCEYFGREIPNASGLGLHPDELYRLYRDPEELERAAPTFNNLPLLDLHIPVSASKPEQDRVVGSTGTDASFEAPYLRNSLVVWVAASIERIETDQQREISAAYHYRADMTPGVTADSEKYDGVMRDIIGNHVALVEEGRAGPDVVVGDAKPNKLEFIDMPATKTLSRKALSARGALAVYFQPKLATDAKIDLKSILLGTTAANWISAKPTIVARAKAATQNKLAADANLDDMHAFLDRLDADQDGEVMDDVVDPAAVSVDADPMEKVWEFLADKMKPEDMAAAKKMLTPGAVDETPEQKAEREAKEKAALPAKDAESDEDRKKREADAAKAKDAEVKAMDGKIKTAVALAEANTIARLHAIRDAEEAVRPFIGVLPIAQDSAAAVYRLAFDHLGVDHKGVDPSAFPAMLKMVPKPDHKQPAVALDAAGAKGIAARFPDLARIKTL